MKRAYGKKRNNDQTVMLINFKNDLQASIRLSKVDVKVEMKKEDDLMPTKFMNEEPRQLTVTNFVVKAEEPTSATVTETMQTGWNTPNEWSPFKIDRTLKAIK